MSNNSTLKRKFNNLKNDENLDSVNKKIKLKELESELINNIKNDDTLSSAEKNTKIKEILIRIIQNDDSIDKLDKIKMYQQIMLKDYNDYIQVQERNIPITLANSKSYHNKSSKILGCRHYKKKCKLNTACCKKWYVCKYCHNEKELHTMDIKSIKKIICMECKTIQKISNKCINEECSIKFANYYCKICKYHNDDNIDIYHCKKCNMCIKGNKNEFGHCDNCNMCLHISILNNHRCISDRNTSNCPICAVSIKEYSEEPMILENCQHIIHSKCFSQYILSNYKCPICIKTITDFGIYKNIFKRYDEILKYERYQIPDEHKHTMVYIYCNDCEFRTETRYHFELHKCQNEQCNSFNTSIISMEKNYYDTESVSSYNSDDDEENENLDLLLNILNPELN